jgi:unsaturated rhamnogalacturonyl hydrolase
MKISFLWSLPALALSVHAAEPSALTDWPAGADPREVGRRVSERFLASAHPNFGFPTPPPPYITYPEVCAWYGALAYTQAVKNHGLEQRLIQRFEPLFSTESHLVPQPLEVDRSVFGVVPLQIYRITHDQRYLELGISCAVAQWENGAHVEATPPEVVPWIQQNLSWQSRFWIDDAYMITALQVEAYRATHDARYLDRAAAEMNVYLDLLQKPNGLFYHAPDVPFFWGRGNGWMAAGLVELLQELPPEHPLRSRILAGYRQMMAALLLHQDDKGMWHQLIDHPEAWPETSCTAMFTFALVRGIKAGWLDPKEFGLPTRRAWIALVGYLDANAELTQICRGTAKKNDLQYYLDRQRVTGAMYGQAALLWTAAELIDSR